MTAPEPPSEVGEAGRRLWRSITGPFEIDGHHEQVLRQAVKVADLVAQLDEIADREGLVIASPHGSKAHPAATEARAQRLLLVRLLASLGLPDSDDAAHGDGRRRGQPRAPYQLHAVDG